MLFKWLDVTLIVRTVKEKIEKMDQKVVAEHKEEAV